MKYESKIAEALEYLSKQITASETFKKTPIFYDFIEVDVNTLPPSCIVYKPLEWQPDNTNCNYQREIDIILIITTEERREGIIGQLFMFSETLKELIDEIMLNAPFELKFIEGSPVQGFQYVRKSQDSYKETAHVFSSMAILRYSLRY